MFNLSQIVNNHVPVLCLALTLLSGSALAQSKAGSDWCGTMRNYEQQYQLATGKSQAPMACALQGECDQPTIRDGFIPNPDEPIMYINMVIHVLADDAGNNLYSSPPQTQVMFDQLNADFAQARIQFKLTLNQINNSAWRFGLLEGQVNSMKSATAIDPINNLNVWVTEVDFGFSFGTFPWSPNVLQSTGGIVMGHFHWPTTLGEVNRVFAHEVGHCLGLWHVFHGVDEVGGCGDPCYESPGAVGADLLGDLCDDTPPTPTNSGPCSSFPGSDPCSGNPWDYTMPENYMGYAAQTCLTTFTPKQRGRMRCWGTGLLDSWVDPFYISYDNYLGASPMQVNFEAISHKTYSGWNWDFGEGGSSSEQTPTYEYVTPGYHTVDVEMVAPGKTHQQSFHGLMSVHADTIDIDETSAVGSVASVDVRVRNYLPVKELEIPFKYDGTLSLRYDSLTTAGTRTSYFDQAITVSNVSFLKSTTVALDAGTQPFLTPGDGPVVKLWFTITGGSGSTPVVISPYSSFSPKFLSYAGSYAPEDLDGLVSLGCCVGVVGDVNGDGGASPSVGDIGTLVDFLFISGSPLPCLAEADANTSGGANPLPEHISVADIGVIVDHLFITGTPMAPCP